MHSIDIQYIIIKLSESMNSLITYQNEHETLPPKIEQLLSRIYVNLATWKDEQMPHRIQLIKEWKVHELRLCKSILS